MRGKSSRLPGTTSLQITYLLRQPVGDGQGARLCSGAAFATVESVLFLARLVRRYDVVVDEPDAVRPVARMTTRPASQIMVRFQLRDQA